jgi:hypothetical protein
MTCQPKSTLTQIHIEIVIFKEGKYKKVTYRPVELRGWLLDRRRVYILDFNGVT